MFRDVYVNLRFDKLFACCSGVSSVILVFSDVRETIAIIIHGKGEMYS